MTDINDVHVDEVGMVVTPDDLSDEVKSALDWWDTSSNRISPEIFERRIKVAQLWNRYGYSIKETAEMLGVEENVVQKDRQWLLNKWQAVVIADMNEIIGQQLAKLEDMERELWVAWEKSKDDEVSVTDQVVDGDRIATIRKTVRKGRLPEHRYMELILRVQERRSKLLGLDKMQDLGSTTFNFAVFVEQAYQKALEKSGQVLDVTPLEKKIGDGQ